MKSPVPILLGASVVTALVVLGPMLVLGRMIAQNEQKGRGL